MAQPRHIPEEKKPDAELWYAFHVDKDLSAIEALYLRHNERIFYFVYGYTQDHQLSLDILQDTFIKIMKISKALAEDFIVHNFSSWAIEISRNLILGRSKNRERRKEIIQQKIIPLKRNKLEANSELDYELLKECIKELKNPKHRSILLLLVEGYEIHEIAKHLNMVPKKVTDAKYLAKKEFKKLLKAKGIYEDYQEFIP